MTFQFGSSSTFGGGGASGATSGNNNDSSNNTPPAPAPDSGSGLSFGSTPAPSTGFSFGGGGGGGGPTPGGSAATSGPAFGATPTAPLFGAAGSSTPAPATPAVNNLFSAAAPTPGTSSTTTPAPAPPPAFSFGGSQAPTTGPSSGAADGAGAATANAPGSEGAPSTFSFGVNAPATSTSATPASAESLKPAAPAPTGFNFGSAPSPSNALNVAATTSTASAPPLPQVTLTVPKFDTTFENLGLWTSIRQKCASLGESTFASQELSTFLAQNATSGLLQVKMVDWTPPNSALRQQLVQKPVVGLEQENMPTKVATLNQETLQQILLLATDLRISEAHAVSLYSQVSQDFDAIESLLSHDDGRRIMDQVQPSPPYNSIVKLASRFYFYERHLKLQSILLLLQHRIKDDPDVLRATDVLLKEGGLIDNLMSLIQEYGQRIAVLQRDVVVSPVNMTFGGSNNSNSAVPTSMAQLHLMFCQKECQMAAEALVFVAYHTQFEPNEVTSLIDLIHGISQDAKKPSALDDVPTATDYHSSAPSWSHSTSQHFSWPQKDLFVWQKELVEQISASGQIELMECISLLIAAAIAAMDSKQVLYNRELHAPNSFGSGNMLLTPGQPSAENIGSLHERFKQDARNSWERQDIWGILACSFALLLRSAPSLIASPRGPSSYFPKEIRETARAGLELAMDVHSFTFCRLTMLPFLEKLTSAGISDICDVSEFGLAIVAEFFASYMNELGDEGSLPISRHRWQNDEEEELKLRQEEQDSQRRFEHWAGSTSHISEEKIPSSVDLMNRPDCLDDLLALATAVCSLGWHYARPFWSRDEGTGSLIPSQILQECMALAAEDESLAPVVLSWLAALSVNEISACAVFELLKADSGSVESSFSVKYRWAALISNLRWYAQELSPNETTNALGKPSSSSSHSNLDTSYYYDVSGSIYSGGNSSGVPSYQQGGGASSTASVQAAKKKRKRLSESSLVNIASHLAVIMNTSLHSAKARREILSLTLQVNNGGVVIGEDETLVVLFKLALAPLPSSTRGATFSTIASLLQPASGEEDADTKSFLEKQGRNGWDYLESCSLLPIPMLDRYFVATQGVYNKVNVQFPPSSLELASFNEDANTQIPKDPLYGIVYEMEHIEAKTGWYPATEGFLELLKALVCAVGCPSNLGESWRPRTGCTPYMEYVLNFVLPRALGLNGNRILPFRLLGDQSRLVAKALAVVDAALVRYEVPRPAVKTLCGTDSMSILDLEILNEKVISPSSKMDAQEAERDFANLTTSAATTPHLTSMESSNIVNANTQLTPTTSVPLAKSPGFTILAELLSSSRGDLLQILCAILTEFDGAKGVLPWFGDQAKMMALSYALYGSTPPTFAGAVAGEKRYNGISVKEQAFLKPLFPKFLLSNIDETSFDDSVYWRERTIKTTLDVLCTSAAKEDTFVAALSAVQSPPLIMCPVLQFEQIPSSKANIVVLDPRSVDVHASRLTDLLLSTTDSRRVRSAIVEYIGFDASTDSNDAGISGTALSLVYRMLQAVARTPNSGTFFGDQIAAKAFSMALSKRLVLSANRLHVPIEHEILRVILNWIVADLRQGRIEDNGIAQTLLGLPGLRQDIPLRTPRHNHHSGSVENCFDAIVDILLHKLLVLHSRKGASVASLCYEILFRLYNMLRLDDVVSTKLVAYTSKKLRQVSFWERSLQSLFSWDDVALDDVHRTEIFHCAAWVLKGLSSELRLLIGSVSQRTPVSHTYLECSPSACVSLLSFLYKSDQANMKSLIEMLPLEVMNPVATPPPREALLHAKFNLSGAPDIVDSYELVDGKIVFSWLSKNGMKRDVVETNRWIEEWNHLVERTCAMAHLTDSISLIICTTTYCCNALEGYHSVLFCSPGQNHQWLHAGGAQDLMEAILRKLDIGTHVIGNSAMDAVLISAATKNLSKAILDLSEFISALMEDGLISPSGLIQLAAMIARAIHSSCIGQDEVDEASNRYVRSNILGSGLVRLLQSSASLEAEFVKQHTVDFIRAAQGLARLSCFIVSHGACLAHISVWARSSLSFLILSVSYAQAPTAEESFVCSCMSPSLLDKLFRLVENLDTDVCELLQTIAMQPFGSQLLIDARICHSLKTAADGYAREDARITSQGDSTLKNANIRAPRFLRGHLKLMCSLLSNISPSGGNELATDCLDIMSVYSVIFQRMCSSFPTDIEDLMWALRCIILVCNLAETVGGTLSDNDRFKNVLRHTGLFGAEFILLLENLLENPLPPDMLPQELPRELVSESRTLPSSVVRLETQIKPSWWEAIPDRSAEFQFDAPATKDFSLHIAPMNGWTESNFNYGIAAAEICSLGLELQRRIAVPSDLRKVARGIHQTIFSAGMVGAREMRLVSQDALSHMDVDGHGNREMEKVFVRSLSDALARLSEQALTLALSLSPGKENDPRDPVVVAVSTLHGALPYITAERREFITALCEEIVSGSKI
ncbi:nuclear pore complex scaffold nucleoporin domain containing protein [Nitzschia inconspicua]|uniref:Nuclear pore complex scaffold nucleoporin domain containing protein n=1 Tax=Nitzschia inconspicua TaxID=303405 RepID=A0A9K3LF82_9STRA|nr:nuclear pore complex scaffold nucleoporin domain containing protein [Nitzschia inconspicua]